MVGAELLGFESKTRTRTTIQIVHVSSTVHFPKNPTKALAASARLERSPAEARRLDRRRQDERQGVGVSLHDVGVTGET